MDHIHEECGVFGIYSSRKSDLASLAYYALFALQHRGQESAGIAVNDDGVFKAVKGEGLVSEVFGDAKLRSLGSGNIAVGHVRYATTEVILGKSLKEQGIFQLYPEEKQRYYVKVPVFSFQKIKGLDAYLSPEMKSTGEAIGYDKSLSRAMYKALVAAGTKVQNYGTVIVTLADEDKEEAVPLIRRFYNLGFNIEATDLTAKTMREHGIKTRTLRKLSEGSNQLLDALRAGHVAYLINTRAILSGVHYEDGTAIRRTAIENGVTIFTSLDTVRVLLDVLEETTLTISTIDA